MQQYLEKGEKGGNHKCSRNLTKIISQQQKPQSLRSEVLQAGIRAPWYREWRDLSILNCIMRRKWRKSSKGDGIFRKMFGPTVLHNMNWVDLKPPTFMPSHYKEAWEPTGKPSHLEKVAEILISLLCSYQCFSPRLPKKQFILAQKKKAYVFTGTAYQKGQIQI